jgi:serine/threonine protein kinase
VVFAPGEEFAGYTIESVLGTGGMGAVYLARHPRLPRRDALKLLNPAFSGDPNFRTRFEREADLASALIHRNIVAVYDRGAVDNQLWITMQYVAGVDASVAARSGDGSMTPHRVVHIISEVGSGLDYAHRAGLLHRDVKPANILLAAPDDPTEPEHVLLTDFGIAKSTDEVQHLTGTGNLLATLAYASPEQIEAKHLDHRVDIYALGCVLYELLTGSVPFPESSPFATMTAHLKNDPPKATDRVPWLPPGFDAVIAKAMAKYPDDR